MPSFEQDFDYFKSHHVIICKDELWNRSINWDTKVPCLTSCLKETLIPSLPLIVLILFLVLDLRVIINLKGQCHKLPWRWRNITNLIINLILILFSIGDVVYRSFTLTTKVIVLSYIFHPCVQLFTYILALILAFIHRDYGKPISLSLNVFWFINSLTSSLNFYSHLTKLSSPFLNENLIETIFTLSSLFCSFALFGLSFILDEEDNYQPLGSSDYGYCPVSKYSFFNRLVFVWIYSTIRLANKKKLETKDLGHLCNYLSSFQSFQTFKKYDNKLNKNYDHTSITAKPKNVFSILIRTFFWPYFAGVVLEILESLLNYLQPLTIGFLISFIGSDEPAWHGYLYVISLFLSVVCDQLLQSHVTSLFTYTGAKSISIINSALYRKIFKLSPASRKEFTVGEISNISSINAMDIFWAILISSNLIIVPLRITITVYFLWSYLGISSFFSLLIMSVLMPICYGLGKLCSKAQNERMLIKDKRTNIISELLNGIKIIKLYAWEQPFINRIAQIREDELISTRKLCYLDVGFEFVSSLAIVLITCSSFILFLVIDRSHVLDPKTVFVCLSLFNMLKWPFSSLPETFNRFARAYTAFKRLSKFLNAEELPSRTILKSDDSNIHLVISNASFSWDLKQTPVLNQINLKIKKGSLVAIIGRLGSGKSSFLSSIVGEMYCTQGDIKVFGSLAYVSQDAWIQNATVKENIVFIKDFDKEKYEQVINSCALQTDLEIFVIGDETEIGERGINLSGGQRQRINLARAVYNDSDIYLLDDPLSAVDANVGAYLFNHVIGKNGLLKNKTRLLVTHSMNYLKEVDSIIIFENGKIKAHDTYQNLSSLGLISNIFEKAKQVKKSDAYNNALTNNQRRLSNSSINTIESIESRISKNPVQDNLSSKLIQDEEYTMGKVLWSHYCFYIKSMMISIFFISFLILFVKNIGDIGASWWLSVWSSSKEENSLGSNIAIYLTFISVSVVTFSFCGFLLFLGAMKAARVIHQNLLFAILRCPLTFFETTPIGRILNRFSGDIDTIDTIIPYSLFNFLDMTVYNILAIGFICFKFKNLIIVVIIVVIIQTYIARSYIWTSRQLKRLQLLNKSPIYSIICETIQGVSSLNAYKAQNNFIKMFDDRLDKYLNCLYVQFSANRWLEIWLILSGSCIIAIIGLLIIWEKGKISMAFGGLMLTYALQIVTGINFTVRIFSSLETSMVALERLIEYTQSKPEAEWETDSKFALPINWPSEGRIKFINYSTSYRDNLDLVLKNINITFEPKAKIGVVGRTGAGKSSLILSLFRIIEPREGTIVIDGVDITKFGLKDLRSKLTIIPQDPVLFSGYLRFNLDPWGEYSDDELWTSLEQTHLKSYFLNFGLDHEIQEGGRNLSSGQKQLVCLARALLRKSVIVILDEATACVDNETDKLIQETIRISFSNSTVITIAHRLNTVIDSDKILVLSKGEVIEYDSPQVLMSSSNSMFYKLVNEAGLISK